MDELSKDEIIEYYDGVIKDYKDLIKTANELIDTQEKIIENIEGELDVLKSVIKTTVESLHLCIQILESENGPERLIYLVDELKETLQRFS